MTDLFPPEEFDDWAESYDASVNTDEYPFWGYNTVLEKTVALAQAGPGMSVLDAGCGTGNLALVFARRGCELWCTDFSRAMLEKARLKLPQAHFSLHDLRMDLPAELNRPFDRIVSAYVFHHFELAEKVRIVERLVHQHLVAGGRMVIADITFPDRDALERLKKQLGDQWEEEFFWVADEAIPDFETCGCKVQYQEVSACAGIFTFEA